MTERDRERVTRRRARLEVHGHRGARGLRPENTLPGFTHALELGVDAIELDVGLTADGVVIVNHDQVLSAVTCCDTVAAWPGDPGFPYVGRPIRELTLAQIRTVEAGVRRADHRDGVSGDSEDAGGRGAGADEFLLTQLPIPGTRLPTLAEVCALVTAYDPAGLTLAVEIKTDPGRPDRDIEFFMGAVADVLRSYGLTRRSRILAFDWRVLAAARRLTPEAGRVALAEEATLSPDRDWLAGRRAHLAQEGLASAARHAGATSLSPHHGLITAELIDQAWAQDLPVTVWTVNDPADMERLIDLGVDAIVTDYPDRLRAVMAGRGLPLPPPLLARTSPILT